MSSNRIFFIAVAVSVLLHLCFLIFINLKPKYPDSGIKNNEPIEISVLPKEKPVPPLPEAPTLAPYIPPPMDPREETTLEHDSPGGRNKGIKKETVPKVSAPSKSEPDKIFKDIEPPKMASLEKSPGKKNFTEPPKPNIKGLFDTTDVTERIANAKNEPPKGEDTASYNSFEQKYASYFYKFRSRVYQLWTYPSSAIMNGQSGVVSVTFSILKDGSIVNIKMIGSSGYPALDREVMRVLKNMGKIPLPESYELEQLNIDEANFIYTMGGGFERFIK